MKRDLRKAEEEEKRKGQQKGVMEKITNIAIQ